MARPRRLGLFSYIEGWYNLRPGHGALEYLPLMNVETKHGDLSRTRGEHG